MILQKHNRLIVLLLFIKKQYWKESKQKTLMIMENKRTELYKKINLKLIKLKKHGITGAYFLQIIIQCPLSFTIGWLFIPAFFSNSLRELYPDRQSP